MDIFSFFQQIKNKVLLSFTESNFDSIQLSLLEESFNNYQKKIEINLFGNTLSLFYLIIKAHKNPINEQAELLGCFLTLYVLSLDLFDDVQDDDLEGKIYQDIGAPIAINNALTLLFLSFKFLSQAVNLETDLDKKSKYLNFFNKSTILAVKGQHKDLMGIKGTATTNEVLNMQKEKASSIAMLAQCAAIFSGCDDFQIEKYKNIAEQMVLIFQIVDDIKDIYGKKISPDLATNKFTYPIACFFENADENKILKFNELKKSLPNSIKEIRVLLYESGALTKSSETIETLRRDIHRSLGSMNVNSSSIRTLLHIVDEFASTIYKVPFLDESKLLFHPKGEWHTTVNNSIDSFFDNMKEFNPPKKPVVLPWHLPQWMYDFKRNIIFYSDLEGQLEDIIPIYSKIIGISDSNSLKSAIISQSPFLMAHELFHYWRKQSGKLTQDYWYEEWVANNLAITYIKTFLPGLIEKTKVIFDLILSNYNVTLSNKANETLIRFDSDNCEPNTNIMGYGVSFEEITYLEIDMANKLISKNYSLDELIKKFL